MRPILPLLAAALLASPAAATPDEAPWDALAAARASFEDAAWTADFVQTWVPVGFTTGERESGKVSLALPGSLRWDYQAPYAKTLLVRLDTAYSWNPGESSGRRAFLQPEERQHLALLELDTGALQERYEASAERAEEGTLEIALTPLDPAGPIRDARLTLDSRSHRLLALRYTDAEGNATEFTFSGHRPAPDIGLFTPPDDVQWLDG